MSTASSVAAMFALLLAARFSVTVSASEMVAMTVKTSPVSMTIEEAQITDPLSGKTGYTRGFDGGVPGPTIRTSPGETLTITLTNNLGSNNPDCTSTGTDYCYANTTNIHTHGLHVSPETFQDDIFTEVEPGVSFTYAFEIPEYHMGGTHMYHPHVHHATAISVGGGAAGVLIVEDADGSVPPEISAMTEHIIFITLVNMATITTISESANGDLWTQKSLDSNVAFVNGQYQPTITVESGTWHRLRFLFAAIEQVQDITVTGTATCQLQLIAKDGVYLHSAPRSISTIYLFPGARADVAVACGCASPPCDAIFTSSTSRRLQGRRLEPSSDEDTYEGTIFSLSVTGTVASSDITAIPTFQVKRPCYLADLQQATISSANQHTVDLVKETDGFMVKWDDAGETWGHTMPDALATLDVGQVHEWTVSGVNGHPFHLHISPYQITALTDADDFYAVGDWHDTFMHSSDEVTVRLQTDYFTGHYVIHCHKLDHEDQGMMAYLDVEGTEGTTWSDAETLDSTCYRVASGVGYTYTTSDATPSPTSASTPSPSVETATNATTTVAAGANGGVASGAPCMTPSFLAVGCLLIALTSKFV